MAIRSILAISLGAAVSEAFLLSHGSLGPALRSSGSLAAVHGSVPRGGLCAAAPKPRAALALRMKDSPFEPDSEMARGARIPDGAYEELTKRLAVRDPLSRILERAAMLLRVGTVKCARGDRGSLAIRQDEVAQWLDDEWIERTVHRDIGNVASKLIEDARRAGDKDVTTLMFAVADGMASFDFYESDVNQFDVLPRIKP